MDIPAGAVVFFWGVVLFLGLLFMAAMFTFYEAAKEARDFFKRENERYLKEQSKSK